MKDEDLTNMLQRDPFANDAGEPIDLPVDALGIPILNDVVELPLPDEAVLPVTTDAGGRPHTGNDSPGLAAIRNHLHEQLQEELTELIQGIVPAVIAKVTRNLASEMGSELDRLLEQRLDQLITRSVDHHLSKPDE